MIVDSAFVFWYGHFIHLHTVIDVLPSWFKDSHKFLQYSCQNDSCILWYCLAFCWVCVCWFVFVVVVSTLILWLFYFSTLTVIGCLIEHNCRALLSWSLRSLLHRHGWRCPSFRLVLHECRTVCLAAVLTVTVACWRATMLLHRHHTMSLPEQSEDQKSVVLFSMWSSVLGSFPFVFFWEFTLKIHRVQQSFYSVQLDHCFICCCKEFNYKERE